MRRWEVATRERHCGSCDGVIAKGTLLLEVRLPTMRYPLVRCQACAGSPVPERPAEAAPIETPTRIEPNWPWLTMADARRPAPAAHLVGVADTWRPFRDGDDE